MDEVDLGPVEKVIADLSQAHDALVLGSGGVWIYVSLDEESGQPINASGFYGSEMDAALASMTEEDRVSVHVPIPLFIRDPEAKW